MDGSVLRSYRILAGLTQADVADMLGRSATYVSLLERGRATPTPTEIEILRRAGLVVACAPTRPRKGRSA